MNLFLTLSAIALGAIIIGGVALNVSPRSSVLDGLRIMLLWLLRGVKLLGHSIDFWEACKALFSGMLFSGPAVYGLLFAADTSKLPSDDVLFYTACGVVVGFVGVAFTNYIIRRLSSGPRP